jgi:exopolyphosphatase/pppGpp-phosphohydrolase
MDHSDLISRSEKKLLNTLESFFKDKWDETKLWSHDLDHHRRVWNYAKELLQYTDKELSVTDPVFIEKLLIACYLHDIGMTIDPGEKHGIHSKKLCKLFLEENKISPADYADLLQAIENHDNKNYTDSKVNERLLLLLSVADDLDAFGYLGIYRYIEIYLARGMQPDKIGPMARANAEKRYNNLKSNFADYPELVKKHQKRYQLLDKFFEELSNESVKSSEFSVHRFI